MQEVIMMAATFLPMVLIFGLLYLLMIRPQKKKDKAATEMRNSIEVGANITTIGGVMGRVVAVRPDFITLETGADRVKLHFAKWAIQSKTDSKSMD